MKKLGLRKSEIAVAVCALLFFAAALYVSSVNGGSGSYSVKTSRQEPEVTQMQSEQSALPAARVNINTASADELETLEGIGETLAARIIEYRQIHGAFECAEDLMEVNGIGEGIFARIRDGITAEEEAK